MGRSRLRLRLHGLVSVFGLVALLAAQADAQDFHFISTRDSAANELNYEIYRYQNGAQTRETFTPVIEATPILWNGLLYFSGPGPAGREIVTTVPGSGAILPLIPAGPGAILTSPLLDPNGASLFVTVTEEDGSSHIQHFGLNGADLGTVVDHGAISGHSPSAATPDGPKLYYSSNHDGDFEIYRVDLDGQNEQKLTSNALFDAGVAVSPNGTQVAFSRQDPFDQCTTQLWVMNHDGTGQTVVTDVLTGGYKAPFGWNGTDILYVSNENGDDAIFSIGADGTGQTLLVDSAGRDQFCLPDPLCGFPGLESHLHACPPFTAPNAPLLLDVDTGGKTYQSYFWTFGDGTSTSTTLPFVVHAWQNPGPAYVTVTGIDFCNPAAITIDDLFIDVQLPQFPGTGDDLILYTGIGGPPDPVDFKIAVPDDQLDLFIASPGGTQVGELPLTVGQLFPPFAPPVGILPGTWVNPLQPGFFILIDGGIPLGPLGPQPILPGGNLHSFLVPPGLSGMDLMLQSLTFTPTSQNGLYSATDGKVVHFN